MGRDQDFHTARLLGNKKFTRMFVHPFVLMNKTIFTFACLTFQEDVIKTDYIPQIFTDMHDHTQFSQVIGSLFSISMIIKLVKE